MTQEEINTSINNYFYCNAIIGEFMYGIVSKDIWEPFEEFLEDSLIEVLDEQIRLNSLVHFCNTGKFLDCKPSL